jgi:hypothetical protein
MKRILLAATLLIAIVSCQPTKQQTSNKDVSSLEKVSTLDAFFSETGRVVTLGTYPTDETSRQLLKSQDLVGVNNFLHKRDLTTTDNQPVVRMNRDTYYSMVVVDISEGATITMPEIPEGKYMSFQVATEDHRIQKMIYGSGTYDLKTHVGTHIYLIVRLDGTFTEEEAKEIQDKMLVTAKSNKMYEAFPIDKASFTKVENALKAKLPSIVKRDGIDGMRGMFTDPRDQSSEDFTDEKYQVGAAIGWGGAQMVDNIYETSDNLTTDKCYQLTFEDPKNTAFWSITVYDKNGFMFNDLANYSSNTSQPNDEGTYTISFGCGNEAPNNLQINNPTDMFNVTVRHYQPSKRVLEKDYRLVPFMKVVSAK